MSTLTSNNKKTTKPTNRYKLIKYPNIFMFNSHITNNHEQRTSATRTSASEGGGGGAGPVRGAGLQVMIFDISMLIPYVYIVSIV